MTCQSLEIPPADKPSVARRFLGKFVKDEALGCWIWKAGAFKGGHLKYGAFWLKSEQQNVHAQRASYALFVGAVPAALFVLHKCNNALCVNPEHLYLGDHAQNMRDRDECGHTSKGAHRYNFKRTDELIKRVNELSDSGKKVREIMSETGIGWGTYWRCIDDKRQVVAVESA